MTCGVCGTTVAPLSKFCHRCGAPRGATAVLTDPAPNPSTDPVAAPGAAVGPASVPATVPALDLRVGGTTSAMNALMKNPVGILVGFVAIAVAVLAYVGTHRQPTGRFMSGAELSSQVEQIVAQQTGYTVTATCADVPHARRGVSTDCGIIASDYSTGEMRLTFSDDEGHFTLTAI